MLALLLCSRGRVVAAAGFAGAIQNGEHLLLGYDLAKFLTLNCMQPQRDKSKGKHERAVGGMKV